MPLLRRDLIALIGAAVTLWPLAGAAQPEKVPTIGVLVVGSPPRSALAALSARHARARLRRRKQRSIPIPIGHGAAKPASRFG